MEIASIPDPSMTMTMNSYRALTERCFYMNNEVSRSLELHWPVLMSQQLRLMTDSVRQIGRKGWWPKEKDTLDPARSDFHIQDSRDRKESSPPLPTLVETLARTELQVQLPREGSGNHWWVEWPLPLKSLQRPNFFPSPWCVPRPFRALTRTKFHQFLLIQWKPWNLRLLLPPLLSRFIWGFPPPTVTIQPDASNQGWGAHSSLDQQCWRVRNSLWSDRHINVLELKTVSLARAAMDIFGELRIC